MILGIKEEDFYNTSLIKIFNGIAGAAKSQAVHEAIKGNYLRVYPTNKQAKDASNRFDGCTCTTMAKGLFINQQDGHLKFCAEPKDTEFKTVVFDEILMGPVECFNWIEQFGSNHNIIITTDTHQLMTPGSESALTQFELLQNKPNVITSNLEETKRPINEETKQAFEKYYKLPADEYWDYSGSIDGRVHDIHFSENDVFLCHTKEIEDYLYRKWGLFNRYDLELLPKGSIASKEIADYTRYPIASQSLAEKKKLSSYLQVSNIAVPHRYQGCEVMPEQNLYFIIDRFSQITNREIYTVITRCKDIKSFHVIMSDWKKAKPIWSYRGKPVFVEKIPYVDDMEEIGSIELSPHEVMAPCAMLKGVRVDMKGNELASAKPDGMATLAKALKHCPEFNYNQNEIYSVLEKEVLSEGRIATYRPGNRAFKKSKYQLDLSAAYSHIFQLTTMPTNTGFSLAKNPSGVNFYTPVWIPEKYSKLFQEGQIVTDSLVNKYSDRVAFSFLFSLNGEVGNKAGEKFLAWCYKDQEHKNKIKGLPWGYYMKKFLRANEYDQDGNIVSYIKDEKNDKEWLLYAMCSNLLYIMTELNDLLHGKGILTDAVYFDELPDNLEQIDKILNGFGYKIIDNETDEVIHQNFQLKKRSHH